MNEDYPVNWHRRAGEFILGFIPGALIRMASPYLVGQAEPRDGTGAGKWYYPAALFLAGVLGGARSGKLWAVVAGIYVGQFTYMFLVLPAGQLAPLVLLFGQAYLLAALTGALVGRWLTGLLRERRAGE